MPFIVETGATNFGPKKYITKAPPPSRSLRLGGVLADAVRFPTRLDAEVAQYRFSSLYGLVVTEEKS